jgi:hypothetical protein
VWKAGISPVRRRGGVCSCFVLPSRRLDSRWPLCNGLVFALAITHARRQN